VSAIGPAVVALLAASVLVVRPAAAGTGPVRPVAVGPVAVGPAVVGPAAVGPVAVGPAAVGPAAVGPAVVGPAAPTDPGAPGYWVVAGDGGVFTFGAARFAGSAGHLRLAAPIVAVVPTPTGAGYWLAAADGGLFSFGDAPFLGSAAGRLPSPAPVVAAAGTPTGRGGWLFSADGNVVTLGDATFWGRPTAKQLTAPVTAATATPSGLGYWMAAADGTVAAFGDAPWRGDAHSVHLARPVVGVAATPSGRGYWLVAADGGVFTYGDAPFRGSAGTLRLGQAVVGLTPTVSGGGYWLVASDGGVFAFGDAPFLGSLGRVRLAGAVVAARTVPAAHGTGTVAFFYPWYGTADHDGAWRHWDQGGHSPPADIGSDYFPLRGAYSSADAAVEGAQMGDLASAGIGEAVVSWWGRGSWEDGTLPGVLAAAAAHGVAVGIHLEPYPGRTPATVAADLDELAALGVRDVWIYEAMGLPAAGLAAVLDGHPGLRSFAETGDRPAVESGAFARFAWQAHFRGIYLYDAVRYEGGDFTAFCATARTYGLLCAPVAAPGFVSVRAGPVPYGRSRENGATYDRRWMGDLGSRPDLVAITSYNEWHEGTQIEPAGPACLPGFCYRTYEGAYGTTGTAAAYAYLNRTGYWTGLLAATNRR